MPARTSPSASPCSLNVKVKPMITCDAGEPVAMGDSTSLTCDFGFDLRKAKQDFYIYRFHYDGPEPVIIALCSWNGIDAHSCDVDHAYNLSTASISRNVILKIPSATRTHAGKYMCKTLPAPQSPASRECSLNATEKLTRPDSKHQYFQALLVCAGCLTSVVSMALVLLVLRNGKFHCVKHLLQKKNAECEPV
ncbi:hypothetical protein V1264_024265 [Littorina saxatilis]|uniref:Ig-like domain-containing protein n=2 Tax=Littorina saxatilis TaxID=31220 RepID=A0AAN9AMN0_9CAEN